MRISVSLSPPRKGECCISDGAGDGGSGDTDRNDGDRSDGSTCISALALCVSGRAIPQRRRRHGDHTGRRHALAPPAAKTMQQRRVGAPHVMANTAARFRHHPLDDEPHGGGTLLLSASASAAATTTAAAAAPHHGTKLRERSGRRGPDTPASGRGTRRLQNGGQNRVGHQRRPVVNKGTWPQIRPPRRRSRCRCSPSGRVAGRIRNSSRAVSEIAVHLGRQGSNWRHGDIVFCCNVFCKHDRRGASKCHCSPP